MERFFLITLTLIVCWPLGIALLLWLGLTGRL